MVEGICCGGGGICCGGGLADSLHTYTHGSLSIALANVVATTENILCVDSTLAMGSVYSSSSSTHIHAVPCY